MLGRRAMAPVAGLTAAARDIERTRDPSKSLPQPRADDEVAELAHTLQAMLDGLEASREETEGALDRQRQFVADASHELRTPLTSILANLELLTDVLDGDRGEAARSALRSSQRMRRLVGDLLLLARADANRQQPREPTDISRVLVEVASELGPVSDGHHLTVDADDAVVDGARDELYRMTLNLMENAIRHTPDGTRIRARVTADNGEVVLTVQDDGPGVAPELRDRIFERFVRGAGDRGSSSGLGLSIVRAVAESHGGSVVARGRRSGSALRGAPAGGRRAGARARGGSRLRRVRVLFTTTGHSGHLLPLVPLARACERAGHDVLSRRTRRARRTSSASACPRTASTVAPDAAWAPLMGRLPGLPQSEGDALIIAEGFARIGAGGALPGFLAVVEQWRPGVLVHECYEFAGPIAAERHGVRTAASRSASPPPRTGSRSWPPPPSRTCAARRASRARPRAPRRC